MLKKIAIATAAAALTVGLAASPAAAAKPANPGAGAGGACVQAGLATLRTLELFDDAVKKQIDYSDFDSSEDGAGFIRTELPEGSFLSLGQVVSLHATNPGLFTWCD